MASKEQDRVQTCVLQAAQEPDTNQSHSELCHRGGCFCYSSHRLWQESMLRMFASSHPRENLLTTVDSEPRPRVAAFGYVTII